MTDAQEKQARGAQDSQTITIEIPAGIFETMYRIMNERSASDTSASSCCDMPRDICCPESKNENALDFTFVLKRKD